jgi:hypothetical protein
MPRIKKPIKDLKIEGPMADRITKSGQRRLMLTRAEKKEFYEQKQIETAVALFLDIEHSHSWDEIAAAVGVHTSTLKAMTKSDQFMAVYNEHFVELGHDPRLKASKAALVDMLPTAIRELRNMITAPETPPSVRLNAIKEILRLNGFEASRPIQSDKQELADFLKGAGLQVNNINVSVPPEFQEKMKDYVDGSYTDAEQK